MISYKLFLFDLDGTLVTTHGAGLRALRQTFLDLFEIKDAILGYSPAGKTDLSIFRELVQTHLRRDITPAESEKITSEYLKNLSENMQTADVAPLSGVMDFVHYLSGLPDAVVGLGTGNLEKGARVKLDPTGLNPYFPFGGFGSDAEDRAEILRCGYRRAEERVKSKIPSDHVYVIGDTPLDVKAARRAGFRAVAVASGDSAYQDLAASQPDHLFKTMADGFSLIENHRGIPRLAKT
jgi:phosphoglycolate phosphatase